MFLSLSMFYLKIVGVVITLFINISLVYMIFKDRIRKSKITRNKYEIVKCNVVNYTNTHKISKTLGIYGRIVFEYESNSATNTFHLYTKSKDIFKKARKTGEVLVFMNMYNSKDYLDGRGYVSCDSNKDLIVYMLKLVLGVCIQSTLLYAF